MHDATKQIARQRVQVLFQQAQTVYKTDPRLAQRYVETARRIAMSARLRLPQTFRRQMCKNCYMFLVPGETSRVRLRARREPHIVTTCLTCGAQTRIPLKIKNKEKTKVEQTINKQDETSR